MRDDIVSILIQLIAETSELHNYTVQQLFLLIKDDITQPSLVQVALWCIGEYGEKLISGVCEEDEPVQVCLQLIPCLLLYGLSCPFIYLCVHILYVSTFHLWVYSVYFTLGGTIKAGELKHHSCTLQHQLFSKMVSFCFQVSEDEVIDVLEKVLTHNYSTEVSKEYAMTSLMKLTSRFRTSVG